MINSRPLTYISDENIEAVTPYHLLHGRNLASRGNEIVKKYCNKSNCDELGNRTKYLQVIIQQYWNRFYQEYTVALREKMLHDTTERNHSKIHVGDVVIIKDDKMKSTHWKHGKITELLHGRDNVVRGVKLQTSSPSGRIVQISRSVHKIIPLEISPNCTENSIVIDDTYDLADNNIVAADSSNISSNIDSHYVSGDNEIVAADSNDISSNIDLHYVPDDNEISNGEVNRTRQRRTAAIIGERNRRLTKI